MGMGRGPGMGMGAMPGMGMNQGAYWLAIIGSRVLASYIWKVRVS